MKYKALSISLLLLLALPMFFMPIRAVEPAKPRLWVNPGTQKFWAPCSVSTNFDVEVKLWNKEEITEVAIYAYDFKLAWNTSAISFVSAVVYPPWAEGQYFIVKNYVNTTGMYYHLAITALDNAPPLIDDQLVLVKITFHIDKEPCYPDLWATGLALTDVKVSKPCGLPIDVDLVDGVVLQEAKQPKMSVLPKEIINDCVCKYFTIEIFVEKAANLYGFAFVLSFDPELLEANIQCVHVTELFPPPYEYLFMDVDNENGTVTLSVIRPCTKPPVSCGDAVVATICFHSKFADLGEALPAKVNATFALEEAYIYAKAPQLDCTTIPITYSKIAPVRTLATANAMYYWRPKVEDLNLDCHVDIQDLTAIAAQYGKTHIWSELAPNTTDPVDIFDIVVVAKKFCKTIVPTK